MREAAAAMITRPELKCAPSAACPQANTSLGKSSRLRFGGWQPDVMVVAGRENLPTIAHSKNKFKLKCETLSSPRPFLFW
jgi:hypothetical protein